jgi:O-antigen ligase
LIWGFVLVMGLYMAHSFREYLDGRHVYRMGTKRIIAVGTSEADPNSFGATIAYALPFVTPLWVTSPSRRWKWLLIGYVALSVTCIGLTGSRSSLLLLLICTAVMIYRSRYKLRMGLAVVLLAPVLWAMLPPSLQNRFTTILDPDVGPANAQTSAEIRTEGFYMGLELWSAYRVTGCGPGAWIPATGWKIESHNLYGQLLGEMGSLGAITFAGILLAYWLNLRKISAAYRDHPEWGKDFIYHLSRALGLSVLLLLIGGWGGHNLFRYSWLWYGGFLILARQCVECRIAEGETSRMAVEP